MARKLFPIPQIDTIYYAHYDNKTGVIYSVSNEKLPHHTHSIEISIDVFNEFISGVRKLHEHVVGYAKTQDGSTTLVHMQITEQMYGFRNNVFEWITDKPTKKTELTVIWNGVKSVWEFKLSNAAKERLDDSLVSKNVVFFVILENDFDFLIRTIFIATADLIKKDSVVINFESAFESRIDKISIASKITFRSYGLIINEQN
jgi:hypothetical protein